MIKVTKKATQQVGHVKNSRSSTLGKASLKPTPHRPGLMIASGANDIVYISPQMASIGRHLVRQSLNEKFVSTQSIVTALSPSLTDNWPA